MIFEDNYITEIINILEIEWVSANGTMPAKAHHTLSFRIRGNSVLFSCGNTVQLNDGDILYVPVRTPYNVHAGNDRLISICFTMAHPPQSELTKFSPQSTMHFENAFQTILNIWTKKEPGYRLRAMSLLYKILYDIEQQSNSVFTDPSALQIKPAIDYIHLHFTDPNLNIAYLCNMINMSDTMFRKYFALSFKETPLKYINRLRIEYATELLQEGIFTVEQVAYKCGFTNSKYFSSVFQNYKHNSPSFFKPKKEFEDIENFG